MFQLYLMYFFWFAAGAVLLAYIGYRRKRKTSQTEEPASSTPSHS